MSLSLRYYLKKYNLIDSQMPSYDNDTKRMITEIINGNVDSYVDSEDGVILLYVGGYYEHIKGDVVLAEKYYLMSVKQNNSSAMNALGFMYDEQNNTDLAKKYYRMAAIKYNHVSAMYNLADLYEKQKKFIHAKRYYLFAIKYNHVPSMRDLGNLYVKENNPELAIKYYLKGILFDATMIKYIISIITKLPTNLQLEILELVPQIRTTDKYFRKIPANVHHLYVSKKLEMQKCLLHCLMNDPTDICLSYY